MLGKELALYNLFLNDGKKSTFQRPYPNHIASAKEDISALFTQYSQKWENGETYKPLDREDFHSYANKIREIAYRRQVEFEYLVRYQLTLFSKTLDSIKAKNDKGSDLNIDVLLNILEIALYVYSLDMNSSTSYKICKIILTVHNLSKPIPEAKAEVEQLLNLEIKRVLDICKNVYNSKDTNIEILNILLLLEKEAILDINKDYIISLFPHDSKNKFDWPSMNYFHICTLLYLFKDKIEYSMEKEQLLRYITGLFKANITTLLRRSECIMLLIDCVTCPYIKLDNKKDMVKLSLSVNDYSATDIINQINSRGTWFFDWNGNLSTQDYLYMKETHSPY